MDCIHRPLFQSLYPLNAQNTTSQINPLAPFLPELFMVYIRLCLGPRHTCTNETQWGHLQRQLQHPSNWWMTCFAFHATAFHTFKSFITTTLTKRKVNISTQTNKKQLLFECGICSAFAGCGLVVLHRTVMRINNFFQTEIFLSI